MGLGMVVKRKNPTLLPGSEPDSGISGVSASEGNQKLGNKSASRLKGIKVHNFLSNIFNSINALLFYF
jgi:hypothetical protein